MSGYTPIKIIKFVYQFSWNYSYLYKSIFEEKRIIFLTKDIINFEMNGSIQFFIQKNSLPITATFIFRTLFWPPAFRHCYFWQSFFRLFRDLCIWRNRRQEIILDERFFVYISCTPRLSFSYTRNLSETFIFGCQTRL